MRRHRLDFPLRFGLDPHEACAAVRPVDVHLPEDLGEALAARFRVADYGHIRLDSVHLLGIDVDVDDPEIAVRLSPIGC